MLSEDARAGVVSEAMNANFSDPRLRARLANVMGKMAGNPSASFPKVLSSAELEGCYRFFGNHVVTPDGILSGHFDRTRMLVARERTALVIHDTSTFAFDVDGVRKGLGRIRTTGQAFFAHMSLVISDDGHRCPFGVAAMSTWVRGEEPAHGEKARWWDAVQLSSERLGSSHNLVHLMDREADDYEFFEQLIEGEHRFIIRLKNDRILMGSTRTNPQKLSHAMARVECAVTREAKLSKRIDGSRSPKQKSAHPSRGVRKATLSIAGASITFKRPTTQEHTVAASLTLNVVRVWEADPPEGETPIEWLLVTTEPIDSAEALLLTVDRYRARWTIEEFFKAIKTGCSFPERQLGDYEGLINALAVFVPIACRLLAVRSAAHNDASAPATSVLEPDEIELLRALGRRPLPPNPTTRDALLAIAALGGHQKWAPDPGWLTISRGFAELALLTRGWRAAKLQQVCDQR